MSPAIMLDVDVRAMLAQFRTPRARVFAALEQCRASRVPVWHDLDRHGVTPAIGGGWHVAEGAPPALSAVGAVCVALQPDTDTLDPLVAAADALGSSVKFVEGLIDGAANALPARLPSGAVAAVYLCGVDLGHDVRRLLTDVCDCGVRYLRDDGCPLCAEAGA